jgi:acyl-CoA synthetase (AMP-forming)/AMP-acid ligase II
LRQGEKATPDEIVDFCREHLARYKCPKQIDFIDALPRSATGKVLKRILREKEK